MTPSSVITDRDTLRKHPPDILLTNYKMLDYLMLRPKDRELWSSNTPTTLRYVVVDELHTFDGAQGTDLALLLRRLRARLKVDPGHLICSGTSATLGGSSDTDPLREYARQVFGVPFEPDSVVTEDRQSVGVFLEDATVDFMFAFHPEWADRLEPSRYDSPAEAVAAWFALFFPEEPVPMDVTAPEWRVVLGQLLKRHQLFVNLLKLLKGGAAHYRGLVEAFARNMPSASAAQIRQVVDALLVLVAWALREGSQPLVTLRVQLWVRELRRMVGKLASDPAEVKLCSERDLPGERDGIYLPMVQCSQCRTTGWLSRLVQGSNKLSTNLEEIYNTWFSRRPEAARFYAAQSIGRSQVEGIEQHVCVACGNVQQANDTCLACGHQELLAIYRVTAQQTQMVGQAQYTRHDQTCPACGERGELLLLGARNATLGSQVVESSWASIFNDDKKLIAFSDSVQDAAHRAGFFGARTYINNVRTAWAHVMDELGVELGQAAVPWSTFLAQAEARFDNPDSILHMPPETLVSEFLGPNMTWLHDWSVELLQHQHLPAASRLPSKVKKRLMWQLFSDLTYLSQRGRSLERIGKAVLAVSWERVDDMAGRLLPVLQEQFGARGLEQVTVAHWLWGMLTRMRQRGGPRKYYVMLYDSVPGGTGYLHQLLAHDAGTLADVLRMALEAVTSCACNADPEKDGCYRCLYQYRLGRSMELVSRDNAKAVLSELVGALDQLERVETISDIYINPNFDSVLEARFIESLKRLSGVGGLPLVKLVQDVVNGKSGWVLDVGTQRYRIEPQCEIGPEFNLTVWSKPDFVIWPWSATSKRKPIAVFCDGWTDHQHCMRADALKRSCIVSSGRLWVWSVTHDDVKAALNGSLDSDLESPLAALSRHDGSKAPVHIPHAQEKAYTQHAVARLLNWLAVGSENAGNDAALPMLQRNALWLGYLMIPATEADKAACMAEFAQWRPRLPEAVQEPGAGFAPSLSKGPSACAVVGWWPMVWAKPSAPEPGWSAPGVVALDESLAGDGETLHLAWRRWLQLYNASQFLPGRLMVTGSGLDGHDYDVLAGASEHGSAGAAAGAQEAHLAAWQDVLDQALSGMRDGLKALAFAGADLPEVGLELADAKGLVIADAELAWVSQKLVVLRPDQADLVSEWVAAGWCVSELDESLVVVGHQPWQVAVAEKLGVKLMNGEDTCS